LGADARCCRPVELSATLFAAGTSREIITAVSTETKEISINFEFWRVVLMECIVKSQYGEPEKSDEIAW